MGKQKGLGAFIRARRLEAGLTQAEVAKAFGYKPQFVTKWERGTSSPPDRIVPKLARVLGVPEQEMFDAAMETSRRHWARVFKARGAVRG